MWGLFVLSGVCCNNCKPKCLSFETSKDLIVMSTNKLKIYGIIPARLNSTRLPRKPLMYIHDKPMIQYVYENAACSANLSEVIVATDNEEIVQCVSDFGGKAVLTSSNHQSGTDRIAEVVEHLDVDYVINIQGDEPLMSPRAIDSLAAVLTENQDVSMITLITDLKEEDYHNPNCVKVVLDKHGYALYFSRSLIPFPRTMGAFRPYKHLGIYGYSKKFLSTLTKLPKTPLEEVESLEQLRALENGYRIKCVHVEEDSIGVDTPEDFERVCSLLREVK